MAITHYVKAAVSEFTDSKTGSTKKRYQTIGIVMETKHGLMLKIESLPLFAMKDGQILAYLNTPEEKPADGVVSRDQHLSNDLPDDPPF